MDELNKRLTSLCRDTMKEWNMPGMAVSIVRDGRNLLLSGFGHRELGETKPVTPRTLFHMASVTKTFTATAVMQLVEKKRLTIDTPIVKYLPDFRLDDEMTDSITARHLMTHTSGIPDNESLEWDRPQTDAKALARHIASLSEKPLKSIPGVDFDYCDIGFEILGHLVARVSGMSYEDYIAKNILAPLRMRDSTLLHSAADRSRLSSPHVSWDGEVRVADVFPYNRRHAPSSTLHSNAADMSRCMLAHLDRGVLHGHRILRPDSYDLLWKESRSTNGYFWLGVGHGFFIGRHHHWKYVGHEGSDCGFRASMLLFPGARLGITVIVNLDGDHLKPLMERLMEELLPG